MRNRIGRMFLYSALILFLAAALSSVPRAVLARDPRAGTITEFGEIVAADPGEDPHLRVDPVFRIESNTQYGSGGGTLSVDDVDRGMLGRDCPRAGGNVTRSSRVYSKLLIMLRLYVGTFVLY